MQFCHEATYLSFLQMFIARRWGTSSPPINYRLHFRLHPVRFFPITVVVKKNKENKANHYEHTCSVQKLVILNFPEDY